VENMKIPKGLYKHFKGNIYKILDTAKHSETLEEHVVYVSIDNEADLWIRPVSMFLEVIERDGKRFQRFEFLGESIADIE